MRASNRIIDVLSSLVAVEARSQRVLRLPGHVAFGAATLSLIFVFAVAGAPIPLYTTYQTQDAISHADLGLVSVAYFVACTISLLILGRTSNVLGRKPVSLAALASAAFSCVLLMRMHSVATLFAARTLQGLACGVASSSLGAYVVDTAPDRPRWLPALITGSAPMVGIPLGAVMCGALVTYAPSPRVLIFVILVTVLLACTAAIALSPETSAARGSVLRSLRPRFQLPAAAKQIVVAAGAAFVATWSLGGYYQAYGPSLVAESLGTSNALVGATVFSSVMILNPFGGAAASRWTPRRSLLVGMVAFIFALIGIVMSVHARAIVPFLGVSLLVGLAQGAASTGAIRGLLATAEEEERAGTLATIYLISYAGAAIPAFIASKLARSFNLTQIADGYALLGITSALIACFAARGRHNQS